MFDLLSDILSSLGKNKLRTILTGSSMAWGVFILIVLLGCGNGLKNAIMSNYGDSYVNYLAMWPGHSSIPFNGLEAGRRTVIDDAVLARIDERLEEVSLICPTRNVWSTTKTYKTEYVNGGVMGITMDRFKLYPVKILQGRNLNEMDNTLKRKVILVHKKNAEILFKGEDCIGEYVNVGNVPYKVIGVFTSDDNDQNPDDYAPLATLEQLYPSRYGYDSVTLGIEGVNTVKQSQDFEKRLRETIGEMLQFDPEDKSTIWVWNSMESYMGTKSIFTGIQLFLWLIGLGTLIAGIVGISNIMLVTVKERTKEFGIRKALGAKPRNIISLILCESLIITASFGYLGLLSGMLVIGALAEMFPAPEPGAEMQMTAFMNPEIDMGIAIAAIVILIIAALLAALVPARKAIEVKPIEALHYNE